MPKKSLGIIICGYSGMGKTTLGKKYENIAEIGQSCYRHIFLDKTAYELDREARKNIRTKKIPNPDWPKNYIDKINELRETHDFVLVFTDPDLMAAFRTQQIPFIIALPDRVRKTEFISNFRTRGQDETFCKIAAEKWDPMLELLSACPEEKIILRDHEYLEDALIRLGYLVRK